MSQLRHRPDGGEESAYVHGWQRGPGLVCDNQGPPKLIRDKETLVFVFSHKNLLMPYTVHSFNIIVTSGTFQHGELIPFHQQDLSNNSSMLGRGHDRWTPGNHLPSYRRLILGLTQWMPPLYQERMKALALTYKGRAWRPQPRRALWHTVAHDFCGAPSSHSLQSAGDFDVQFF